MGGDLVRKATGEEIFGQCLPAPRGHIPEVAPVDREAGGVAAKCQAFRIFERERPVCRSASGTNPEALFDVVEELVGAGEHARDVRADSYYVAAHRLEEEHVVEARGASYLGGCELEQLGDVGEPVGAQVAVLLLQDVQDRDEGGALDRVQSDQFSRSHEVVVVQPGHVYRSLPRSPLWAQSSRLAVLSGPRLIVLNGPRPPVPGRYWICRRSHRG